MRRRRTFWQLLLGATLSAGLALTLGVAAVPVSGCDLLDIDLPTYEYDPCSSAGGAVEVGGTWTITGSGTRTNCNDPDYETEFRLGPSQGIVVVQETDATGDTATLSLADPGGSFDLSGMVDGRCVVFETSELLPDGSSLIFSFEASSSGGSRMTGSFTATRDPWSCDVEGTFEVVID